MQMQLLVFVSQTQQCTAMLYVAVDAHLSVDRLTKLNKLCPGRIIQVHFFQELVGHSLQRILGPDLQNWMAT